jgi:hypothetical protein
VTLLGYQRALCDLVASPQLCLSVRADAGALDSYDLTRRERDRLVAVTAQRGMSTNCTLYRVNRITPLYSSLPLTCTLLGDDLIHEAERYWSDDKPGDLQFGPEARRFGRFLQHRLDEGAIASDCLAEVLELELAVSAMRSGDGPPTRSVRFSHDPLPVLEALADGRQPDMEHAERGDFTVRLTIAHGRVELSLLPAAASPRRDNRTMAVSAAVDT